MAFAERHPGALAAHFLNGVGLRLGMGPAMREKDLHKPSVTAWAQQFSGVSEVRDQREILTIARTLDYVNRQEIGQALDVLVQRIVSIQSAKMKGGSWEKSEQLELIPTGGNCLAAPGVLSIGR